MLPLLSIHGPPSIVTATLATTPWPNNYYYSRIVRGSPKLLSMSTPSEPPRAPPVPALSQSASQSSKASRAKPTSSRVDERHQFVRTAEDLAQEVNYLVQPLSSRAGTQTKILTLVYDVNPVIQQGPMCGLVALSIASQLLNGMAYPPDRLLARAKDMGYSKQGEMFSALNLLDLAHRELHCTGAVLQTNSVSVHELLMALTEGKAVVVPYDADKNHSPCIAGGTKAHWCTLVGFAVLSDSAMSVPRQNPSDVYISLTPMTARHLVCHDLMEVDKHDIYLFARHGKSRHLGLWSYSSLVESNANLKEVDPQRDSGNHVIPTDGISSTLCSLLIILQRKG